ncbi:MAG: hypothetical protein QXL15_00515 [Candidatus Korarchaeota archaeon]
MADREKLQRGEIKESTVEICRVLYTLESEFKSLRDLEVADIVDVDDVVVLIVKKGQSNQLQNDRTLLNTLKERIKKKKILVTEKPASFREIVQSLLHPRQVISMNTVYLPDGTSVRRIVLSKKDYQTMIRWVPTMEKIIFLITGESVSIKPTSE